MRFALPFALLTGISAVEAYLNVNGGALQRCSHPGMALTGWTRNGQCVDYNDDGGSHHICIDLSSNIGGNFCSVTRQPNWCGSQMACDQDSSQRCPVQHWCVCQWAFSAYIDLAGGCDQIQDIVCEATNMAALDAYRARAVSDHKIRGALECLESRCLKTSTAVTPPLPLGNNGVSASQLKDSKQLDSDAAPEEHFQENQQAGDEAGDHAASFSELDKVTVLIVAAAMLVAVGIISYFKLRQKDSDQQCDQPDQASSYTELEEHSKFSY